MPPALALLERVDEISANPDGLYDTSKNKCLDTFPRERWGIRPNTPRPPSRNKATDNAHGEIDLDRQIRLVASVALEALRARIESGAIDNEELLAAARQLVDRASW